MDQTYLMPRSFCPKPCGMKYLIQLVIALILITGNTTLAQKTFCDGWEADYEEEGCK